MGGVLWGSWTKARLVDPNHKEQDWVKSTGGSLKGHPSVRVRVRVRILGKSYQEVTMHL